MMIKFTEEFQNKCIATSAHFFYNRDRECTIYYILDKGEFYHGEDE